MADKPGHMALSSMDTEQEDPSDRRQYDQMTEIKDVKKLTACELESATDWRSAGSLFETLCLDVLNEAHCDAGLFHLFIVMR